VFISVSSKRTSKPTWDTKGCHAADTHLTPPGSIVGSELPPSDIPGSRAERQPRREPSLTTLFGSWSRVSARSTPRQAGSLVAITMGASSLCSSSRRTEQAAAAATSCVKRQLINLGQGSEVRHRCDCCCLRDAHASNRAHAAGLPRGRIGIGRQHFTLLPGPRLKRRASDTGE
jgi:hypothetical protein